MKRTALYLRVSSVDQHPEMQLYDLRQMADRRYISTAMRSATLSIDPVIPEGIRFETECDSGVEPSLNPNTGAHKLLSMYISGEGRWH